MQKYSRLFLLQLSVALDLYHKTYQEVPGSTPILYPENFEPCLHAAFNNRIGTFDPEVMTYLDVLGTKRNPGQPWPKKTPENMILEIFKGGIIHNIRTPKVRIPFFGYERSIKENSQTLILFNTVSVKYTRIEVTDIEKVLELFNIEKMKPVDHYMINIDGPKSFMKCSKTQVEIFKCIKNAPKPTSDTYMSKVVSNFEFEYSSPPIKSLLN